MAEPLQPIQTVRYKTYVKEALIEALTGVFVSHADTLLRGTKITIDFPFDEIDYPAVVVRFYERQIKNAGIGHDEMFPDPNAPGRYIRYKHYLYDGDIEFAIYALSSLERDLISDSLVQTLAMADLETYTNNFLARIYSPDPTSEPASVDHMINLNTDTISGFGETQAQAPWGPEDVMVYQTAYRVGIFGEFYSRTPEPFNYGLIDRVDTFPYMPANGEVFPNPPWPGPDHAYGTGDDQADPAPWQGS